MRASEVFRLVGLNINQNKFKTIMTSIGIVAGAATIVMVIAIGRGGQMDVAEQFSSLNAGAIDVTYEYEGEESSSGGFSFGNLFGGISNFFGGFGGFGGGSGSSGGSGDASGNSSGGGFQMPGGSSDGGGMPSFPGGSSNGSDSSSNGNMPSPPGNSSGGSSDQDDSDDTGSSGMPSFPDNTGSDSSGNGSSMTPPGASSDSSDEAGSSGAPRMDGFSADESTTENVPEAGTEAGGTDAAGTDDDETSGLTDDRMNQTNVIMTESDVDDIVLYVSGITGATISYDTRSSVEGASLTDAQTYTIVGAKENFQDVAGLTVAEGDFITDEDDESKQRICVLGASVARDLYSSAQDAVGQTLYIDDRTYTVAGVLDSAQTVTAGITPDEVIFVPYETGIKYITGSSISPTITVIAENVNDVSAVETAVENVLEANYSKARFTFTDAGSKMEAAESSNRILTMLLTAMAVIVFLIGGIGIMNVLFVSVKERTEEIGILKALGASRAMILSEFLTESAAISLIGGILGVAISFVISPIVEHFGVRVEPDMEAYLAALGFAVLTGTMFGFYPAWKASRLVPVEALNAE